MFKRYSSNTATQEFRLPASCPSFAHKLRAYKKTVDSGFTGYEAWTTVKMESVSLPEANLLSSQTRGTDKHMLMLDLDVASSLTTVNGKNALVVCVPTRRRQVQRVLEALLAARLITTEDYGTALSATPDGWRKAPTLTIPFNVPLELIPSSTPGHFHLFVDHDPVEWSAIIRILKAFRKAGVLERHWVGATVASKRIYMSI